MDSLIKIRGYFLEYKLHFFALISILIMSCSWFKEPSVDVHFTVITNQKLNSTLTAVTDPKYINYNDETELKKFVDILNDKFVMQSRDKIIHFKYKSMTSYQDAIATSSPDCLAVVATGQGVVNIHDGVAFDFGGLFNQCLNSPNTDSAIADPDAINVYIFDSFSVAKGNSEQDSGGGDNNGQPVLRIDFARIYMNGTWDRFAVFEHEMGHAFGLKHFCNDEDVNSDGSPDGNIGTPSNIMSSTSPPWPPNSSCNENLDYMGDRSIGFNASQLTTIIDAARNRISFVKW